MSCEDTIGTELK